MLSHSSGRSGFASDAFRRIVPWNDRLYPDPAPSRKFPRRRGATPPLTRRPARRTLHAEREGATGLVQDSAQALVALLAGLRRERRQRSGLDAALVPPDAGAAYRIAARVEAELGWRRLGWKIAATRPAMQRALRAASPIYGRVFAPFLLPSPAVLDFAPLLHPLPECEYMLRLAHDLPPRARPYAEDELREAVAAVSPGIEVAECRFVPDAAFPPLEAILADGAGSGTLVLGAEIEDWVRRDIAGQTIVLRVDGVERRRGTAREALGHPLEPLTWLANELSRTGIGLRAGEVVSTGTCTGMLKARAGEEHVADYGPFGEVRVRFVQSVMTEGAKAP